MTRARVELRLPEVRSIRAASTPATLPNKSGVRLATEKDVGQMVEMFRTMLAESTLRGVPLHEAKFRAFLKHMMTPPDQVCFVYESRSGRLDGMMIGHVAEHFFSLEKTAADVLLFVRPERRGAIAAARLWTAFRDWAQRAGATMLSFGTLAGIDPERSRRFYTGLGMTEVGSIYLLHLERTG
jgi:GNAT superfamily N-acetyltransferase